MSRLAVYSWAFFAVGCALALPGAALAYLAEKVGRKEADLGILFTMRGAAYATASLLGGVIGEILNAFEFGTHLVMSISMSMAALGMWAASRSGSVIGLGISLTGTSIAMGALDTVGNIATLRSCERVRRGAAAAMSVVHASFGIGCVAAPALITHIFEQSLDAEQSAFNTCAILSAGCAFALCMVPSVSFRSSKPLQQVSHDSCKSVSNEFCIGSGRDPSTRGLTAFAASLLIFTYVGIEQGTGALLSTWAYRSLERGHRRANDLTLTFWFAMVAGRLLAGISVPDDFRADLLVVVATLVATGTGVALAMTNAYSVANLTLSMIVFCLGCAYGALLITLYNWNIVTTQDLSIRLRSRGSRRDAVADSVRLSGVLWSQWVASAKCRYRCSCSGHGTLLELSHLERASAGSPSSAFSAGCASYRQPASHTSRWCGLKIG